jgi:hypothetical protein
MLDVIEANVLGIAPTNAELTVGTEGHGGEVLVLCRF